MKNSHLYMVNLLCTCLLLLLTITFTSCKKFVEVPPPPDLLVSEKVFTDDSKATSVVTSIYGSMINGANGYSNHLINIYAAYAADELIRFNPSLTIQEFMTNELTPENGQVSNIWNTAYKHIYYANAAIEGLERSNTLTAGLKEQLIGECKFIRAFSFFYLVNLWGEVPLVLTSDYNINATLPRSSVTEVYEQIKKDLMDAKSVLPPPVGNDRTRASKWAATAMLARVYLFEKQWNKAGEEATAVIASGLYTPLGTTNIAFLANAKESVWQLAPRIGLLKETAQLRVMGTAPQNYLLSDFVTSFQTGDKRKAAWIDSTMHQTNKYYYPRKYRNATATPVEFYTMLRVAEQFLIRAEARLELGNLAGAIADINIIKGRAGIPLMPTTATSTEVRNAIEKERAHELFIEWGHRWFDLKRWQKSTAVLGPLKPGWQPTDELFPIPLDEILSNTYLTQNPGY